MNEREQKSSTRLGAEAAEREQRVLAEALADTAAILNRTLDLDEVLDRILEQVGRVAPHQGANIMLIVESDVVAGKGATFRVWLPQAAGAPGTAGASEGSE